MKHVFLFLVCCLSVSTAWALPRALTATANAPKVTYYIVNQEVRSAMNDLSKIMSVPITLAPDVRGKATAGKYNGTALEILDKLCNDMSLHRFYDGNTLYVTRSSAALTKVVDLKSVSIDDINTGLVNVGIDLTQFPVRFDAERNLAILYGPPRYIAMAEAVADQIMNVQKRSRPFVMRGGG